MRSKQPTIDYDVRPAYTIAIRPIVDAVASKKLHLDRGGEILVQAHAFGGLRMDHDAVIPKSPSGPP